MNSTKMRGRIRGRRLSLSLFFVSFFCGTTTLPTRTAAAAFVVNPPHLLQPKSTRLSPCYRQLSSSSSDDIIEDTTSIIQDEDAALLQTVTREQLVQLCESCHLSVENNSRNGETASKTVLLQRLRDHAAKEAAATRERLQRRRRRVQDGGGDSKERYEVVNDNDAFAVQDNDGDNDLEEEEAFFFYSAPDAAAVVGHPNNKSKPSSPPDTKNKAATSRKVWTSSTVTAPPIPHDVQPDANGERSVKIYSTTDQNDLTAMASAQPGQASLDSLATAAAQGQQQPQPWDLQSPQQKTTSPTNSRELERAKEQVVELVSNLLALSGAPAFAMDNFGDDDDGSDDSTTTLPYSTPAPRQFVGFHPANVPTEWLARASPALRAGRGQVLQDVLRQFELQAVGQDGLLGDNRDRGGGHYAEVTKVRAFLEGYRRAEVRRLARATTTMLLDELCRDGVQGLDRTLSTMVRSSDDTGCEAGELNDSLVDFLNDAVRQQERRVDELTAAAAKDDKVVNGRAATAGARQPLDVGVVDEDPTEQLWNVTMEDGQRVETLDPNDPNVQRVLQEEAAKTAGEQPSSVVVPESAPEKLLLLLTLLRERVKAEAVFGSDEKGRNLRLLAYCLQVSSNEEREQLILNAVGNSLDVSATIGTKLAVFSVVVAAF